jgi:hypothetical protein
MKEEPEIQTAGNGTLPAKRSQAATEINRLHGELAGLARITLEKGIRIGELLAEQKAQLKHGDWLPWVNENLEFSERTARNYLSLFQRREELKSANIADLTDAYRMLAGPAEDDEPTRVYVRDAPLVEPKKAQFREVANEPGPGVPCAHGGGVEHAKQVAHVSVQAHSDSTPRSITFDVLQKAFLCADPKVQKQFRQWIIRRPEEP